MRMWWLAGLAYILVACSDPTGVAAPPHDPLIKNPAILIGSKINLVKGPNFDSYTDFSIPSQTPLPSSQSPGEWCDNARKQQVAVWSDQRQSLVWDDWNVLQTNPVRPNSGRVLTGRLRIKFQGFVGTYSGQPIQCVRVLNLYYDKERFYPRTLFQSADNDTQFWIGPSTTTSSGGNWAFCLGSLCATKPAALYVMVQAQFVRRCHLDISVANCVQFVNNGQIVWEIPETGYWDAGQWMVKVQANGFWTVLNYGGNPVGNVGPTGNNLGWWRWGPSGYYLLGSYGLSTTSGFAAYNEGQTHWVCCS